MRILFGLIFLLLFIGLAQSQEQQRQPVDLNILYLARVDVDDHAREESFLKFLRTNFANVKTVARDEFEPSHLEDVDVALIDWSQMEEREPNYPSPVGGLEEWRTPTVLLGSAGLIMAGPWQVIGGAG